MMELKRLDQEEVIDPDRDLGDPTMGQAFDLAVMKMKNGTLTKDEPNEKENCAIFWSFACHLDSFIWKFYNALKSYKLSDRNLFDINAKLI